MAIDGEPGSGRTRFVLSAPRPIYVVSLDAGGLEGVLEDATGVEVATYDWSRSLAQNDAKVMMREVEDDIRAARDMARTVVIDKATELWQAIRLAEFGRFSGVKSRYYEGPNTRMSEILRYFVDSDTNLLLIHDRGGDYAGDEKVGTKRAGFAGTEGIVRHAALFSAPAKKGGDFSMEVTKCTTNAAFIGETLVNDDISFALYASQAVPQVDPSSWL